MPFDTIFSTMIFPCPGCGADDAPPGGRGFCPECMHKLQLFRDDQIFCSGCGGVMDGALAVCSQCLAEPIRPWHHAVAVFPYRKFGKRLIREMKFSTRPELSRPLAVLAAEAIRARGVVPDVLVPVPLHWTRYMLRGYNQAELLADGIGRELKIPVLKVLKRRSSRKKQSLLGRRDRHRVTTAFYCTHPEKLRGMQVMLVDDVLTTGATLNAVARALPEISRENLSIVTIARTPAYGALPQLT